MTTTDIKSPADILEALKKGAVPVIAAEKILKGGRSWGNGRALPHRVGECKYCGHEARHLDAHEARCYLNPDRKYYDKTTMCPKCKLQFPIAGWDGHVGACHGDMTASVMQYLKNLRVSYMRHFGVDTSRKNRTGINNVVEMDYPEVFVHRSYEILVERGMPKVWKLNSNMQLLVPKSVPAQKKDEPKTISLRTADDFALAMAEIIGLEASIAKFDTLVSWRNLTAELLS